MIPVRFAMWSDPRNISTAMMRSWGNRSDAVVRDEPLYAHYLTVTGYSHHPGYAETLAAHEADWRKVVAQLLGPIPHGKRVFYQKHMSHHLVGDVELDWIDGLTNCLLIREPRETLASMGEFLPLPRVEDTGLPQQVRLFERLLERHGEPPAVIDAADVLRNPRGMLGTLCRRWRLPFEEAMLEWPPGPRDTDGAWGPFWYDKVYRTTKFGPVRASATPVPTELPGLLEQCEPFYRRLYRERITIE